MTIGRKPVLGFCGSSFPALSEQEGLRILKDCFGDTPESTLLRALNQSKVDSCYNVEVAFNWLLDNICGSSNSQTSSSSTKSSNLGFKEPEFCASTRVEIKHSYVESRPHSSLRKDDIQMAIEASLETGSAFGGQISAEEQELSKVIEASIAENKKDSGLNLSSFLLETVDPRETIREEGAAAGIRNVGNTCWFSVVVQAFYHLPSFRRWICDLKCDDFGVLPVETETKPRASKIEKEAEFVVELRRLFGLLTGSRRKYVDPTRAVDVLRRQESLKLRNGGFDDQQDVSEFTHLVLEWTEEAFNALHKRRNARQLVPITAAADTKIRENIVQQLFYGSLLVECRDGDGAFSTREEKFSQYPLQVVGFDNLADSLESSMSPSDGDEASGANQRWLRTLPPVLIFELNRFRFNQGDKASEKIHSRFTFPDAFFADRYLFENRELVAEKSRLVKLRRQRLKSLQECLRSYEEFGDENAKKMSLLDSLNCVSYFCRVVKRSNPLFTDVFNNSGVSETGSGDGETDSDSHATADPVEAIVPQYKKADEELFTTENFLNDWQFRIEKRIADLKVQIAQVELEIESAYDDEKLKSNSYVLHAVLVHEGQAAAGHYFLYLRDFRNRAWRKFNDVQVTEASWPELERDFFGGYQNTSAYCLFYTRADRPDLQSDIGETPTIEKALRALPEDLRALVERENEAFARELDARAERSDSSGPPEARPPRSSGAVDRASPKLSVDGKLDALIVQNLDVSAHFCVDIDATPGPEDEAVILNSSVNKISVTTSDAFSRFDEFVRHHDGERDPRVLNLIAYAAGYEHPYRSERVINSLACDVLLRKTNSPDRIKHHDALQKIRADFKLTEEEQNLIIEIHKSFNAFCSSVLLVSFAIENYFEEKYANALKYVILAENFTAKLHGPDRKHPFRGLRLDFVKICSAKILEKWSLRHHEFYLSSTNESDLKEFLMDFERLFLPTLNKFLLEDSQSDYVKMAEGARLLWMALLQNEEKIRQIHLDFRPSLVKLASKLGSLPTSSLNPPAMTAKCTVVPGVAEKFAKCLRKASSEWNFRWT